MTKQNTESCLSLAILGFLSIEPASGYGLRKIFLNTAARGYSASPGAIYPALQRLEAEGFIEGTVEKRDTLRPRMVYSLTGRGKEELIETLRSRSSAKMSSSGPTSCCCGSRS
jgi:Predicted transcriptional regulators